MKHPNLLNFQDLINFRENLWAALSQQLPATGHILELESETCTQLEWLPEKSKGVIWFPSDLERKKVNKLKSMLPAHPNRGEGVVLTEVLGGQVDGVLCTSVIEQRSTLEVVQLLKMAKELLKENGFLMVCSPFMYGGNHTSEENMLMDLKLKIKNSTWGIKDQQWLKGCAAQQGLSWSESHQLSESMSAIIFRNIRKKK